MAEMGANRTHQRRDRRLTADLKSVSATRPNPLPYSRAAWQRRAEYPNQISEVKKLLILKCSAPGDMAARAVQRKAEGKIAYSVLIYSQQAMAAVAPSPTAVAICLGESMRISPAA